MRANGAADARGRMARRLRALALFRPVPQPLVNHQSRQVSRRGMAALPRFMASTRPGMNGLGDEEAADRSCGAPILWGFPPATGRPASRSAHCHEALRHVFLRRLSLGTVGLLFKLTGTLVGARERGSGGIGCCSDAVLDDEAAGRESCAGRPGSLRPWQRRGDGLSARWKSSCSWRHPRRAGPTHAPALRLISGAMQVQVPGPDALSSHSVPLGYLEAPGFLWPSSCRAFTPGAFSLPPPRVSGAPSNVDLRPGHGFSDDVELRAFPISSPRRRSSTPSCSLYTSDVPSSLVRWCSCSLVLCLNRARCTLRSFPVGTARPIGVNTASQESLSAALRRIRHSGQPAVSVKDQWRRVGCENAQGLGRATLFLEGFFRRP